MPDLEVPRVPGLLGPLFEEAGRGDRQAREALFLSFNLDLGFFESRLLGPVRSAGAAVTVVGDGSAFDPDLRGVRAAGYGYALGLTAMRGAFHPKLTVLAGPQRAVIGIGSGNLTVSGWHANDEVLTVVLASREEGVPTITGQVAGFLDRLPHVVPMSPLAAEGVARTAQQLAALQSNGPAQDTGHRFVHSLDRPVLEQLPRQRADVLELAAPFHDLTGRALDALLRRFAPEEVRVLVQPGQTVMEPDVLQRAADGQGVRLLFVEPLTEGSDPQAYRHGKLITAFNEGAPQWSLVGSPNLSAAALLGTAPGSNCEIAVLSMTDRSLFPRTTVAVDDVASLRHVLTSDAEDGPSAAADVVRLLEARAVEAGVEVTLSRATPVDLLVERSDFAWPPERFVPLGTCAAGQARVVLPALLEVGARIRIGEQVQVLAFPDAVTSMLRPSGADRVNHDTTPAELFASETVAAEWSGALTRLLLSHGRATAATNGARAVTDVQDGTAGDWRTLDDPDAWAQYAETALDRLGLPVFQLASGTAAHREVVGAGLPSAAPAWEDVFDDTSEAYEEERTAEQVDDEEQDREAPARPLAPARRARLRSWVAGVAELAAELPPLERIAVVQLVTAGTSAQIWDDDGGWARPLATALQALAREDWPSTTKGQAAAVSAIGLYRLRMAVAADERGPEAAAFREAAKALRPLVAQATPEAVTGGLTLLDGATLRPRSADEVLQELQTLMSDDSGGVLVRVLEQLLPAYEFLWLTPVHLRVSGPITNPVSVAAAVLPYAEEIPRLAITVDSENGRSATVVRVPDRLTVVQAVGGRLTYRTHRTTGLLSVAGLLTNTELAQTRRLSRAPFTEPDAVDLDVLDVVGLRLCDGPEP